MWDRITGDIGRLHSISLRKEGEERGGKYLKKESAYIYFMARVTLMTEKKEKEEKEEKGEKKGGEEKKKNMMVV